MSVDAYVIDTLMRDLIHHDRRPSAFVVYLYLWRRVGLSRDGRVYISHQSIAEATGLSRSAVQRSIALLSRRRLIRSRRATATAIPEYSLIKHWN